MATYAQVKDGHITALLGDAEPGTPEADRLVQGNAPTIVVLDLAEGETPTVGAEVDVDDDGVATLTD